MINSFFKILGENETGKISAKYLPQGKAWGAKNVITSNLFKYLNSIGSESNYYRSYLNDISTQFDINITTNFLEEWETLLGIPDDCFSIDVDITTRRNQCLAKIKARGVQTSQDLVDIIQILGYESTITTRYAVDPTDPNPNISSYELLITFLDTETSTIFPVTFPWFFGQSGYLLNVECFIKKIIPATCTVSFGRSSITANTITMQNGDTFTIQDGNTLITN